MIALGCLGVAVAVSGCFVFRRSLPQIEGVAMVAGLSAPVRVERDFRGVPALTASNRLDLARALGFLHAQDRFFQMDLYRRAASGELAELLGPVVLDQDKSARRHGLRAVAMESVRLLPDNERRLLDAYTEGVNQGLLGLRARPPEYVLLGQAPRPWQMADSILVLHAMALALTDHEGIVETELGVMRAALSDAAFDFFAPEGTEWDAPVDRSELAEAAIPNPAQFTAPAPRTNLVAMAPTLRRGPGGDGGRGAALGEPDAERQDGRPILGSNAFAVGGTETGTGSALVANDMHLELHLPNTWYHAALAWTAASGTIWRLNGATLPGSPMLTVGSNGKVAWAFTASALDTSDVVELETSPAHPGAYRSAGQWKAFGRRREVIRVRGRRDVSLDVPTTEWGPVLSDTNRPRAVAIKWVMHAPEAANLHSLAFETAESAHDLLAEAPHAGLPFVNVIAGDHRGNIGWTVAGLFPKRVGFDGRLPGSWADGARRWEGWIPASDYPRVENPPGGRLWSGNQRMSGDARYAALGRGTMVDLGARSRQIRDDLEKVRAMTAPEGLAVQLDDRAILLGRWQALLMDVLRNSATTNRVLRDQWLEHVGAWGGRAATNSIGYRLVRAFRHGTLRLLHEPVRVKCMEVFTNHAGMSMQFERPAWRMLTERPAHLLNRRFPTYDALLDQSWQDVMKRFPKPDKPLEQRSWGDRNMLKLQHPFSLAVKLLGRWMDAPSVPMAGDMDMPRVFFEGIGASQRMVVSPGHEEAGIYHQPGGASGHFLSPFYLAGHHAWVGGEPSPLQPGPAQWSLLLRPAP